MYVDTDMIFLRPVEELWKVLSSFKKKQFAALALEDEEHFPPGGWYKEHSRCPYYGNRGEHADVCVRV